VTPDLWTAETTLETFCSVFSHGLHDLVDRDCTDTESRDTQSSLAATSIAGSDASEARACGFLNFEERPRLPPSHLKHFQFRLISLLAVTIRTRSERYSRIGPLRKWGFSAAVVELSGACRTRNDWIIFDICIFQADSTLGLG
jgi:hypothetical protein